MWAQVTQQPWNTLFRCDSGALRAIGRPPAAGLDSTWPRVHTGIPVKFHSAKSRGAPPLTERALEAVRQWLLDGQLVPGRIVSEADLARRLRMSRTPVGEALRQLVREGLMEQVPRVGTRVRAIERGELQDLYEMREALEAWAAERAAARIAERDLTCLRARLAEMQRLARHVPRANGAALRSTALRRFLEADLAFHRRILAAAGNRAVLRAVDDSRALPRLFQIRRQRHDRSVLDETIRQHREILEALSARNGPRAAAAMRAHVSASLAAALAAWDRDAIETAATISEFAP